MIRYFSKRPIRKIDTAIIHCSVADYGSYRWFWNVHVRDNGWDDIGYHFIILNSKSKHQETKVELDIDNDGRVLRCRDIDVAGAHCKGDNENSVGICLVGVDLFSARQLFSLMNLIWELKYMYPNIKIKGHYEMESGIRQDKTCPNIDMDWLRKRCGVKNE